MSSRDYARPHRPRALRWFNTLGASLTPARLPRFDVDELEAAARAATGLSDFGDPRYRPALERLAWSLEHEARLHPIGRLIQRARLLDALESRLRLEAMVRAFPDIEAVELGPVIVIAGLQRTGTTKLHRLLAADPDTRALASWESLDPIPDPADIRAGADVDRARRRRARLAREGLRYMAPDFFAVHPIECEEPEEDILLLDLCFSSQTPEATLHVPSYAAWVEGQDQRFAYEHLLRCLKLLSWLRGPRRWVLKSPHHLEQLDTIAAVFDRPTVVWTHRDPRETTASFCSMVAHGRGLFSDAVDPHEIGRHWLAKIRRVAQRGAAARGRDDLAICDVHYADLVADPLAEVARIYACAGLALTREAVAAMRKHDGVHRPRRYGAHDYALADFGLTPARVDEELGFLRELAPRARSGAGAGSDAGAGSGAAGSGSGASGVGHDGPLAAMLTGWLDLVDRRRSPERDLAPVDEGLRLDGRVCLVTGANSGLGRATARALALRGATLILACRGGVPETAEQLRAETQNPNISMIYVDLADLDSVEQLCATLRDRGVVLDLAVLNAGLMPQRDRPSAQGYEVMFAVHVLANATLLRRFMEDGVLRPAAAGATQPRVVIVSSEAHRSAPATVIEDIGRYFSYGVRDGLREYGRTKLMLSALAVEARRRVAADPRSEAGPWLAVHALCPGPVATNIGRDAPGWMRAAIDPLMAAMFNSPEQASVAVDYLACAPQLEGHAGEYLHIMRVKAISEAARDPEFGAAVWDRCAGISAGEAGA